MLMWKRSGESPEVAAARSSAVAAWLAAIITLLTFAYSLYTDYRDKSEAAENIVVDASRHFADYPSGFVSQGGRSARGILSTYWQLIIANNGTRTVSITSYELSELRNMDFDISYTGLDQGIFDENLKRIQLPVSLEAGHSTRLLLRVGILTSTSAYSALLEEFSADSTYSIVEIERHLTSKRIDFFGNEVYPLTYGSGFHTGSDSREQMFEITLRTAKGSVVSDLFSWYALSFPTL
jgi:hypothetical protein